MNKRSRKSIKQTIKLKTKKKNPKFLKKKKIQSSWHIHPLGVDLFWVPHTFPGGLWPATNYGKAASHCPSRPMTPWSPAVNPITVWPMATPAGELQPVMWWLTATPESGEVQPRRCGCHRWACALFFFLFLFLLKVFRFSCFQLFFFSVLSDFIIFKKI